MRRRRVSLAALAATADVILAERATADPSNDEVTTVGNEKRAIAAVTSSPFVLACARAASAARARSSTDLVHGELERPATWSRHSAILLVGGIAEHPLLARSERIVPPPMMALSSTSNAEHRSNMEISRRAGGEAVAEARDVAWRSASPLETAVGRGSASARGRHVSSTISCATSLAHLHAILVDRWRGWRALLPCQDARERFDFARERRVQMPTLDAKSITAGSDNPAGKQQIEA